MSCDYEEELNLCREPTTVVVCGEEFQVTKEFYQCPNCGKTFINSLGHRALDEAYRKYRKRHGMLQPEEIRQWREEYELTLTELSQLLDWEGPTLSWHENGALQEEAHEKLLQSLRQPLVLLRLIDNHPAVLSEAKQNQLRMELSVANLEISQPCRVGKCLFAHQNSIRDVRWATINPLPTLQIL